MSPELVTIGHMPSVTFVNSASSEIHVTVQHPQAHQEHAGCGAICNAPVMTQIAVCP